MRLKVNFIMTLLLTITIGLATNPTSSLMQDKSAGTTDLSAVQNSETALVNLDNGLTDKPGSPFLNSGNSRDGGNQEKYNSRSTLTIIGNPLDITVSDAGMISATFNDIRQYYSTYRTYLFYNDTTIHNLNTYTAVSNSQPDPWTIVTVLDDTTSTVRLTQTVSYTEGSKYYSVVWSLQNNSGNTYTNSSLIHGGDTYFGGYDSSEGHYDATLGMVYLTNPNPLVDGIMGFYGHPDTPADHYYEGNYSINYLNMRNGSLPDSVNGSFLDAGYSLQWDRSSFAPGEVWTITAYEKWTEAGNVQVFAPAPQNAQPGDVVSYSFNVQNLQSATDNFTLSTLSTQGWNVNISGGNTIGIGAASTAHITVELTVPAGLTTGTYSDVLTLTATSQSDGNVTNSDAVTTTVEVTDIPGCTNSSACNYNPDATVDDGSCLSLDCAGDCGGSAALDECGVCGGDNSSCADCAGVPNGSSVVDDCGVCGGDNSSCADCAGIPYGPNSADECGVCDSDLSNDNVDMDCAGVCYGTAHDDICGNCVEGTTGIDPCTGQTSLYFGDVDYANQTIEIRLTNESDLYGFQFQISGASGIIDFSGTSGGSSDQAGFTVDMGGDDIFLGFSYDAVTIPPGDGVLTTLSFDGCGFTELCIVAPEMAGVGPIILPVEVGECISFGPVVGDVNIDGSIDVLDVAVVVGIIFGEVDPTDCQFYAADVFTNGYISIIDIVQLIQNILGSPVIRGNDLVQANLYYGDGMFSVTSEGDIAGMQLEYFGEFEITESHLSAGWEIFKSEHTILIFSANGTPLTSDALFSYSGELNITSSIVTDWQGSNITARINSLAPVEYTLNAAYPNPFNPVTSIGFVIPDAVAVSLIIYDMNGRELAVLANGVLAAGYHNYQWNADGYSSGLYFVKMITPDYTKTQKLMLMK
ncbi:MAG: T9SS type A sorting domain-containing protein [Candidatus Marinimicrobia bacterium]|nr:T9SS type A sorting domain-containing protein [Candidatus Neomarinimicrobiota bacterium]